MKAEVKKETSTSRQFTYGTIIHNTHTFYMLYVTHEDQLVLSKKYDNEEEANAVCILLRQNFK